MSIENLINDIKDGKLYFSNTLNNSSFLRCLVNENIYLINCSKADKQELYNINRCLNYCNTLIDRGII